MPEKKPKNKNIDSYLDNENVKWFLYNILQKESDKTPEGNVNYGGYNQSAGNSTAFGAGQFIGSTRNEILDEYGVDAWSSDFSEQQKAILSLLHKDGDLDNIAKGNYNSQKRGRWEAFSKDKKALGNQRPEGWGKEYQNLLSNAVYEPDASWGKLSKEMQDEKTKWYTEKYNGLFPGNILAPKYSKEFGSYLYGKHVTAEDVDFSKTKHIVDLEQNPNDPLNPSYLNGMQNFFAGGGINTNKINKKYYATGGVDSSLPLNVRNNNFAKFNTMATPKQKKEFYELYGPIVEKQTKGTGLYPQVILAQLALESAYGTSLAAHGNLGGRKVSQSQISNLKKGVDYEVKPTSENFSTKEKADAYAKQQKDLGYKVYGKTKKEGDEFVVRVDQSFEISGDGTPESNVRGQIEFLERNKRYRKKGVFDADGPKKQAELLKDAGYATDAKYASKIENVYKQNDFPKYTTEKSDAADPTIKEIDPIEPSPEDIVNALSDEEFQNIYQDLLASDAAIDKDMAADNFDMPISNTYDNFLTEREDVKKASTIEQLKELDSEKVYNENIDDIQKMLYDIYSNDDYQVRGEDPPSTFSNGLQKRMDWLGERAPNLRKVIQPHGREGQRFKVDREYIKDNIYTILDELGSVTDEDSSLSYGDRLYEDPYKNQQPETSISEDDFVDPRFQHTIQGTPFDPTYPLVNQNFEPGRQAQQFLERRMGGEEDISDSGIPESDFVDPRFDPSPPDFLSSLDIPEDDIPEEIEPDVADEDYSTEDMKKRQALAMMEIGKAAGFGNLAFEERDAEDPADRNRISKLKGQDYMGMLSDLGAYAARMAPLSRALGDANVYDQVRYPRFNPTLPTAHAQRNEINTAFTTAQQAALQQGKLDLGALSALATQQAKTVAGVEENVANERIGLINQAQQLNNQVTMQEMNDTAANKGAAATMRYQALAAMSQMGQGSLREMNMRRNDANVKKMFEDVFDEKWEQYNQA